MLLSRPGHFIIGITVLGLSSCTAKKEERPVERSFYYWRSVLNLAESEKQKLDSLQVKTIYLKFFDVDWDDAVLAPVPVAKLQSTGQTLKGYRVIPTVFITNASIQKTDPMQTGPLAEKILQLVNGIIRENHFDSIPELQIDCDWTAGTQEKYFSLLQHIRQLNPRTPLSATIRLHQVKYMSKTGVPPVDRGLLMCYNMGNLKDPETLNSILETAELKKYTGNLSRYPLPLDIALPLFDWKVLFRNNRYRGLIQHLPAAAFNNSFSKKTGNRYVITKDTILEGYDLRRGDLIRDEQSPIKEILAAAKAISMQLQNTQTRVSLYHMDSVILSKYKTHELESIYNSLH